MTLAGPTSNSFVSQRLRLHYVDWGNPDAPPLILQHGGKDHCRSWDWVAQQLRHDWHVICPDLRGHGDSAWSPDGAYSMDAYVYDLAQFVHTLGHDEVTIIAHSLGGNIATRFTGLYPEKVRRLVNIEGLGPAPQDRLANESRPMADRMREWITVKRKAAGRLPRRYPSLEAALERMKEENGFLSDDQARHLTIHGASRNEDGTWSWKFDNYLHVGTPTDIPTPGLIELWQAITCPVLLFYGTRSFFKNPRDDGRMSHFRDARLVVYDDAGHWLHHDRLEDFIKEVKIFI